MRRRLMALMTVLFLFTGFGVVTAPAASAHPYCGLVWGSLAKGPGGLSPGTLVDVRTGRHACYDRLVLDVGGGMLTGWSVRYVDQVVGLSPASGGSGFPVPVSGGARLQVVAGVDVIPTDAFFLPDGTLADVSAFRTFRHVAWAGSDGDRSSVGLGVRARLPFRAFVLAGPGDGSRLVVDVAHRWCAPGHTRC